LLFLKAHSEEQSLRDQNNIIMAALTPITKAAVIGAGQMGLGIA